MAKKTPKDKKAKLNTTGFNNIKAWLKKNCGMSTAEVNALLGTSVGSTTSEDVMNKVIESRKNK